MSRLLVSALSVQPGRIGGAEFMIRNLAKGFSELADVSATIAAPIGVDRWPATLNVCQVDVGNRFVSESTSVPRLARDLGADAVLFPNYFTPPHRIGVRAITVIHDVLYRRIPDVFEPTKRLWLQWCHSVTVKRASRVVAISDSVAQDLRAIYGARADTRLVTIPNPIDWTRFDPTEDQPAAPVDARPYLLSVAAEWPHKNIATLIRAYAGVRGRLQDCALILVGQTRDSLRGKTKSNVGSVSAMIDAAGLNHDVWQTGHIPDSALGHLYRGARGFVFPSSFEGFGMPPVEALGMGLPVVTTRCGALLESTKGLAHYVTDPHSHLELGEALVALARDPRQLAPDSRAVQDLRNYYAPARIAGLYAAAMAS